MTTRPSNLGTVAGLAVRQLDIYIYIYTHISIRTDIYIYVSNCLTASPATILDLRVWWSFRLQVGGSGGHLGSKLFEGTSPEKDFFRVALAFDALFGDFWASLDFFLACLWVALGWFWYALGLFFGRFSQAPTRKKTFSGQRWRLAHPLKKKSP